MAERATGVTLPPPRPSGWVETRRKVMVMAHVPLQEHPKGAVPRLATGYTKRRFGQTVEPLEAAAHHSGVLVAMGALETVVQFGWKKLDPSLRWPVSYTHLRAHET